MQSNEVRGYWASVRSRNVQWFSKVSTRFFICFYFGQHVYGPTSPILQGVVLKFLPHLMKSSIGCRLDARAVKTYAALGSNLCPRWPSFGDVNDRVRRSSYVEDIDYWPQDIKKKTKKLNRCYGNSRFLIAPFRGNLGGFRLIVFGQNWKGARLFWTHSFDVSLEWSFSAFWMLKITLKRKKLTMKLSRVNSHIKTYTPELCFNVACISKVRQATECRVICTIVEHAWQLRSKSVESVCWSLRGYGLGFRLAALLNPMETDIVTVYMGC